MSTITVVGLGPGADDHVTVDTLRSIEHIARRHLRTAVHPSAHLVLDAPSGAVTHDDLYESADTFDDVYAEIAERLIADAAVHGDILYAVPGSPLVLERTVRLLRERSAGAAAHFTVDLRPAMSFLDVAWARLGIDPVEAGARLVDGHEFATAAADQAGPLLIAHTHANWVLSDIKLAVESATGDEAVV
ncbi:MAG: SAM-dependent methyltransferase, partial [Ilumatobacter sp.]